jgi:hypothetical protein
MKTSPIRSIAGTSLANIIAIYYAIGGFATIIASVIDKSSKLSAPLGLLFPYLSLKINLTYARSDNVFSIAVHMLVCTIVYGVSGWLTGYVGATVYNLLARIFGLRLRGTVDAVSLAGVTLG